MPSIRYINQSAPFWDFVASLEEQGSTHPFLNARDNRDNSGEQQFPWGFGHPWGGWGHPPHRDGHHGPHRSPHHGPDDHSPPPPPDHEGPAGPPPHHDGPPPPPPPPGSHSPAPPGPGGPHREHPPHRHRGCPGRRGGRHGFGRGRWHGPGDRSFGSAFNLGALGEFLQSQIFGDTQEARAEETETREAATGDYKPDVDVFDTESAFVIHASLPGAKKEDVGVNWDAEKSELSIAGVIYRPGDEDFLKTLAMDERKVGPFERKIRLGSRANPAVVDADGITAKLEDGILRVEVPKEDKDYVEIKKVDVE